MNKEINIENITSVSNIISQIPEHPVLNIQCQTREEIKTAITLLFHWTIAQRTKKSPVHVPCISFA